MKIVYLTSKTFPVRTADHAYVRFLAQGFASIKEISFELVVRAPSAPDLSSIPVRTVKASRHGRTLWYFFWLPFFLLHQREAPLVIFSNDQPLLLIALFWRSVVPRRIIVCADWHELSETWKDRVVAQHSDLSISTSNQLARELQTRTGIDGAKLHVVYGGIDLQEYAKTPLSKEELGLPVGKQLVGYVGLFTTHGRDKGLFTMIDALTYLPEEVSMVFVGARGDEEETYEAYAQVIGVQDRCMIFPMQSFERVSAYQQNMDVLVIPYPDEPHFRKYGFPMKTYEYLASRRPIVYSNLPIIAEVLSGRGIPAEPGDPASFGRAIAEALSSAAPSAESINEFSWEFKARAIVEAIQSTTL